MYYISGPPETSFLTNYLQLNIEAFSDAYNSLLIEEEDYRQCETQLTASTILKTFTLQKLEKHAFLEFRLLNFLRSLIL